VKHRPNSSSENPVTLHRWVIALLFVAVGSCGGTPTVTCSSSDNVWHFCQADTREGARLVKQLSAVPCLPGKTWGWDDKGIWVDYGCGGQFALNHGDTSAYRLSVPPLPPTLHQDQDQKAPSATEENCEKTIGKKEARKLVDECLQVSPATHPPCNAANSCALIWDEIKRSCDPIGKDAPKFCKEQREQPRPSEPMTARVGLMHSEMSACRHLKC